MDRAFIEMLSEIFGGVQFVEVTPKTLSGLESNLKPKDEDVMGVAAFLSDWNVKSEDDVMLNERGNVELTLPEFWSLRDNVTCECQYWQNRARKAEECLEKVKNFIGVAYPDVE